MKLPWLSRCLLSLLVLGIPALAAVLNEPEAFAECRVLSSPETYTAGQVVRDVCDIHGTRTMGFANAAGAPTVDASGNMPVTLGTLFSGEDQPNNLLMTSGGIIRTTTFGSVTSATTSTVSTVPTGAKTFVGQIINATSETKAATATIYGNLINSTTGGIALCTLTLPSTATTLQLQDACPITTVNFPFYFYTVTVYTSASAAPFTVYATY
jgi:hypothetical protein